jgi:hypothetical protein
MKPIIVVNTGDKIHAESLLARSDLQVTFVTEERFINIYPQNTDIIVVEDLNDPTDTTKSVINQRDCNHYKAVVSLSERAAPAAAYLRSYLGLEGISFDTIMNCTNKYAMKRRFTAKGIPTAAYSIANSVQEILVSAKKIGWPIIVKPIFGAGTDATKVFQNEDELYSNSGIEYFNKLKNPNTTSEKQFPVIVEEFVDVNTELHCDGYVQDGKVIFAIVSKYIKPVIEYSAGGVYGSYTIDSTSPLASQVLDMHIQAVKAVGLKNGVTHFEVFQTAKGLLAGELACRPGGGGIRRMLQLQSGFDSWDAHLAISLGEKYTWERPNKSKDFGQIAQFMLPVKRGIIKNISSPIDFEKVEGFIEADIRLKPGDEVSGLIDSAAISGLVFVRVKDENNIENIISMVDEVFFLEVN